MTYRSRLLGAAGVCALAVLGANPAPSELLIEDAVRIAVWLTAVGA